MQLFTLEIAVCVCNGGAWKKIASFLFLILTCPERNKINTMNSRFKKKKPTECECCHSLVSQAQGSDKPVPFSWTVFCAADLCVCIVLNMET